MRNVEEARSSRADETRRRIVGAAVELLIARGLAATTTAEVQRHGGFSRGALLHHFPTREELLGAAISELLERNEAAVKLAQQQVDPNLDPIERAMHVLRAAVVTPAFVAEIELWAASRTDPDLRRVLVREERLARRELERVLAEVFGNEVTTNPNYLTALLLTEHFFRGLAISSLLRSERAATELALRLWSANVRLILAGKLTEFERGPA